MEGFEPVTISWQGESYTVPADGQLMLVARIESALREATGKPAMQALLQRGGPDYAALAMGFGAALRHAGANVTDDAIYLSIQSDFTVARADTAIKVQNCIMALVSIISPPMGSALRSGGDEKKPEPTSGE